MASFTKTSAKMSGADRREAIIVAARNVFIEKGFHGTTTRELAKAASVSEALMFKHFPSKDELYLAIRRSCFKHEESKIHEMLEALDPSTRHLVLLVRALVSHVLEGRDEETRLFFQLVVRSLMDEAEFTKLALQGGPAHWVKKVKECMEAASRAGDMIDQPTPSSLAGWLVHQLVSGIMVHSLPSETVVDYGVSQRELAKQVVWFSLRGMGVKEEAIGRYYGDEDICAI